MSSLTQRQHILTLMDEAVGSGVCLTKACEEIGIASSTLSRWRPGNGEVKQDLRPTATRPEQKNKQLRGDEQQRMI